MKTFEFNGEEITITRTGYGRYRLEGLETSTHTTDSEIYDWCDDDSDPDKHEWAKEAAYILLAQG